MSPAELTARASEHLSSRMDRWKVYSSRYEHAVNPTARFDAVTPTTRFDPDGTLQYKKRSDRRNSSFRLIAAEALNGVSSPSIMLEEINLCPTGVTACVCPAGLTACASEHLSIRMDRWMVCSSRYEYAVTPTA